MLRINFKNALCNIANTGYDQKSIFNFFVFPFTISLLSPA